MPMIKLSKLSRGNGRPDALRVEAWVDEKMVEIELASGDCIANMSPRQALRVADALTRAALKAEGKP